METCKTLPESYTDNLLACFELERSKILSRLVKTVSVVLMLALFGLGCLLMPPESLTAMEDVFEHLAVLMLGLMAVMLLRELVRGFLMRAFSGVKPIIRYAGAYPYAGCEAYFGRSQEWVICLAPMAVILAVTVGLLGSMPDDSWRWMIWIMLTVGVCSCVGDLYVAARLAGFPADILVRNVGPTYLVYGSRKGTVGTGLGL